MSNQSLQQVAAAAAAGAENVSMQEAMQNFNNTMRQFLELLSRQQGNLNKMLDPGTMGQIEQLVSELGGIQQVTDVCIFHRENCMVHHCCSVFGCYAQK